jgi:hypothetical protein
VRDIKVCHKIEKEDQVKRCLLLAIGIVFVVATTAHAVSLFGPAEPAAEPGKFSSGVGYFYYDDFWKNNGSFRILQNQLFAEGSYSFYKGVEVFMRFGGADAQLPDLSPDSPFKDNMKPYGGIGARGVLYKFNPQFDIGGSLYVDRVWSDYVESVTPLGVVKLKAPWSANFALLGEWTPYKVFVLYGGPKFFYGASTEDTRTLMNGMAVDSSRSIRTDSLVGGVLGTRFAILGIEQLKLGLELQFTNRVSVGGMASYSF